VSDHTEQSGTILSDGKKYLKVACADGFVHLTDLQLAGKKRMRVEEFLRGFKGTENYGVL
jgi:methionyl-tRNA formyltransferase